MSADRQPVLSDARVLLRPLVQEDWDALFSVAADPLIWAGHPAQDRRQEPVFRPFFDDALASGGALAILDASTGTVIGSSRFDTSRAAPGEVEIGWTFLARAYWGGVVNAAVKRLMIGHALRHFDRTIFLVAATNIRSQRAMDRIGGRLTDRRRTTHVAGHDIPHLVYAIDPTDFAEGPLSRS